MLLAPQSVYIIAEAGVNHDGDEKKAHELVDIAVAAGADAVKFQMFSPQALVTRHAPTARYQAKNLHNNTISQLQMLEKLTLPDAVYVGLSEYCKKRKIDFLCTPFDHQSLRFLEANTSMRYLKLASGEVANGPLLLEAARTGLPIILSTGMSTLDEIGAALTILYYGYEHASGHPPTLDMPTPTMLAMLREKVILLHCVSQYPAPVQSMNLLAMDTLAETFSLPVGLSDHSPGITMGVAASARGAYVIEKHLTRDITASGPDHAASLSPESFTMMVSAIREVSAGLGDGEKDCRPEELNTREVARRSVVAARAIAKGTAFTEEHLICKRPATGEIVPNQYWDLLGKAAKRDYAVDDFIEASELKN